MKKILTVVFAITISITSLYVLAEKMSIETEKTFTTQYR